MPQFGTSAADDDDQLWAIDDKQVNTTDFTEMYSTSTGAMTRDLDDPYAFEKKPQHYIPGYTGHLPLNRERFGINYREASADTIAMQKKKGVHNPVVPLDKPPPNYVRCAATPPRRGYHVPLRAAARSRHPTLALPLPCVARCARRPGTMSRWTLRAPPRQGPPTLSLWPCALSHPCTTPDIALVPKHCAVWQHEAEAAQPQPALRAGG